MSNLGQIFVLILKILTKHVPSENRVILSIMPMSHMQSTVADTGRENIVFTSYFSQLDRITHSRALAW